MRNSGDHLGADLAMVSGSLGVVLVLLREPPLNRWGHLLRFPLNQLENGLNVPGKFSLRYLTRAWQ